MCTIRRFCILDIILSTPLCGNKQFETMYENEALKWNFMNPNKLSRGFYYCLIWHLPLSYEFKFTQEVQQIMNPNQRIFDFMFSVLLSLYYSFSVRLIYKWKKKQKKTHIWLIWMFSTYFKRIFYIRKYSVACNYTYDIPKCKYIFNGSCNEQR